MRRLNWTTIALIGGLVVLLLLVAYFAGTRNPDQDKLSDVQLTQPGVSATEKLCGSKTTYDLIKRDLFRRAGQLRGSDQAAYDRLAAFAVVRMDNPVMESEDQSTGAVNCSGTLSLDLPPGVAVADGRRTLMSDIDFTVQPAANGSRQVVLLRSADAIIAPLATLVRITQPPPQTATPPESNDVAPEQTEANVAASQSANVQPGPTSAYPGRPSFDCAQARTRSEIAVCQDSGLSSLDLNTATEYRRALGAASPAQRQLLQSTRNRFLAFRDRCRDSHCISEAYLGRMREIRDIMEGRWQSPR
jgi:uncharacterized protein YecT (DUF1311 family)